MSDVNLRIGARLRELRSEKKLTLEMLSEMTGVSVSMLSEIERGRKSPTLTILNRIKNGLHISLSELFDETRDNDRRVTRREDMRFISPRNGGGLWAMTDCIATSRFEVMRQEMAPNTKWVSEPHFSGNSWEYCIVIQGSLTMIIDGESYEIGEGDVFSFMTDVEHTYINNGDNRLILVVVNAYK